MDWIQDQGLAYLQFPMLSNLPGFFHGIFLRQAADQQGKSEEFNLGMGCGTPEDQVWSNRQRMLDAFGKDHVAIYARQVHGTQVGIWNSKPASAAVIRLHGDALVTQQAASALVILTADCQSVIVIDPVKRVAANIHSGWRGSIGNIIGRTIQAMVTEFACRPQDLVCGIGPSLGPCCAEFINYRQEIPRSFWRYRHPGNYFDFWQISMDQLAAAGVRRRNISVAGICTKCNQHLFFSYRGDSKTGRFAAVVGLRSDEGTVV
jgi:YfiH family protein